MTDNQIKKKKEFFKELFCPNIDSVSSQNSSCLANNKENWKVKIFVALVFVWLDMFSLSLSFS